MNTAEGAGDPRSRNRLRKMKPEGAHNLSTDYSAAQMRPPAIRQATYGRWIERDHPQTTRRRHPLL
jgi:hypothetical protein